jgi:hypothetical protein
LRQVDKGNFIWLSENETIIAGKCTPQASINKEPYSIEITNNSERKLMGGRCEGYISA